MGAGYLKAAAVARSHCLTCIPALLI